MPKTFSTIRLALDNL